jgi:hypothetical protein
MMFEAFVAWAMAQPNWSVLRGLLDVLNAACAPDFQGERYQAANAAMQLKEIAMSGGFEELAEVFGEMEKEYR